jgi:NDP-sugar pyrophosphorylase family protein
MNNIKYAIILAGGKGERLRPLTNDRPKPMVEIAGKPILGYQIDSLRSAGVTDIVISCGYKHDIIEEYFGDGHDFGLNISYTIEEAPLGRGGGIKAAMKKLPSNWTETLVLNGDILCKINFKDFFDTHLKAEATVTDLVVPLRSPYGIVDFNDKNQVLGFREKPILPFWINGGIYVFSREIEPLLPEVGDHETETFPTLPKEKFVVYKSEDYWRGVDTVKDKTEAEKEVAVEFPETTS